MKIKYNWQTCFLKTTESWTEKKWFVISELSVEIYDWAGEYEYKKVNK